MGNKKNINEFKFDDEKNIYSDLELLIEEVGHYLPSQGPVSNFVHHNTLHHFEDLPFFEGVELAGEIFSANSYLPEEKYQSDYKTGRINLADIGRVLSREGISGEPWLLGRSKRNIIKSFMLGAIPSLTAESLRWRLLEKGYLLRFLPELKPENRKNLISQDKTAILSSDLKEALAGINCPENWGDVWPKDFQNYIQKESLQSLSSSWKEEQSVKLLWLASILIENDFVKKEAVPFEGEIKDHSTYILPLKESLTKIEELINPYLIKFTSAFLDAGLAHLHVGQREKGIFYAFICHLKNDSEARPAWLHGKFSQYEDVPSVEVIKLLLEKAKVPKSEWGAYLLRKALILRGWGGLIHQLERGNGKLAINSKFADFMAVRLLLEDSASSNYIFDTSLLPSTDTFQDRLDEQKSLIKTKAFHVFRTLQLLGLSGSRVLSMSDVEKNLLFNLFSEYDLNRRSRLWHQAYEWNFYSRFSSSLLSKKQVDLELKTQPKVQLVCCIDDREESFRRYLEEISPEYETFGTAGFFGVDAEFHSLYERPAPFCPANMVPTHKISVVPKSGSEQKVMGLGKLKQLRSDFGVILETNSRSLFRGWLLALGGILALVPLSIATLSPRWGYKFKSYLKKILINPSEESAFVYAEEDASESSELYTLEEMCHRVRMLLTSTGLIRNLSPLVVIAGHGSFSTNNPYRSAYDCGACGGRPGRMNSRVFSLMANRSDVRTKLAEENFIIPPNVHFVGAFHNTCTDEVEYFDIDSLPDSHTKLFIRFKADVEIARARNAMERCRRFDETHINSEKEAIAHVESRAHHIAQPRPEYNHATNALCIVGRRALTRNLFLDRRSLLVSYDKTLDPTGSILAGLLRAVTPVCMGINLEYFFSTTDNQRYGAGSKLPQNVTSLLGLMTGYCSDLRTGLPAQMVEIHEAVRLLMVIDMEPDDVLRVIKSEPAVYRLIENHWVQLMAYSAETNEMYYFNEQKAFEKLDEIPTGIRKVPSYLSWALNKTDHLEFVELGA